ncbi:hypothetical protein E2562_037957 [Oryza meyeriana var. granulata]|uniref:Uncharacterized protein n=1 Tax=Oryza meyeriana var. granulata TaxID=110450 RepID=A0A6G1CKW5_9ORYZ|nr:hypothetical protein E2562_037957 [Oryza meyeriana var. granulata]
MIWAHAARAFAWEGFWRGRRCAGGARTGEGFHAGGARVGWAWWRNEARAQRITMVRDFRGKK